MDDIKKIIFTYVKVNKNCILFYPRSPDEEINSIIPRWVSQQQHIKTKTIFLFNSTRSFVLTGNQI